MDEIKRFHFDIGVYQGFKLCYQLYTDKTDERLNKYKDDFKKMGTNLDVSKDLEGKKISVSQNFKTFHLYLEDDNETPIKLQVEEGGVIKLEYSLDEILEYSQIN